MLAFLMRAGEHWQRALFRTPLSNVPVRLCLAGEIPCARKGRSEALPAAYMDGTMSARRTRRMILFLALLCLAAAVVGVAGVQAGRRPVPVRVESAPRRAAVYVNGRYVGHTPLTLEDLVSGPHVLRVVHPDRQPHRSVINPDDLYGHGASGLWRRLRRNEPLVRVELQHLASSWLAVESIPGGAEVLVNGELRGMTPLRLEDLAPGSYDLIVRRTGYVAHRETVVLEPDEGESVQTRLHSRMIDVLVGRLEEDPYNMQDLVDLAHQYLILGMHQESADTLREAFRILAEGKATARPDDDERPELRLLNQMQRTFVRFHTYPEDDSHIVREVCMELMEKAVQRGIGGRRSRTLLQQMQRYAERNP